MKRIYFTIIFALIIGKSCKKEDLQQKEIDDRNKYLTENNITVTPTASGLYYIEITEGTGIMPVTGNLVKVHYKASFLNGEVFDSSYERDEPFFFELGKFAVIDGWEEGIRLMKQGGKALLIVPSDLAYGASGYDEIPEYSTLLFEIELLQVLN